MQVHCKASTLFSDVRCRVCGQGFLVYWTQRTPAQRAQLHVEIVEALREHHATDQSTSAHSRDTMYLPEWGSTRGVPAERLDGKQDGQAAA